MNGEELVLFIRLVRSAGGKVEWKAQSHTGIFGEENNGIGGPMLPHQVGFFLHENSSAAAVKRVRGKMAMTGPVRFFLESC